MTSPQQANKNPLQQAYDFITENQPMKALAIVLGLLRQHFHGDERRVFEFIQKARESYQSQERINMLIHDLQALSLRPDDTEMPTPEEQQAAQALLEQLFADQSILGKAGREQVIVDAHSDGSSVICSKCHQLIAATRWEQHVNFWCPALATSQTSSAIDDDESESEDDKIKLLESLLRDCKLQQM